MPLPFILGGHMDKKIVALAEAIRTVFREDKRTPMILENEKMPRGYLERIRKVLPNNFAWPKENSNLSRYFVENKQDILNSLKADDTISLTESKPTQAEQVQVIRPDRPEPSLQPESVTRNKIVQIVNEVLSERILELNKAVQVNQAKLKLPPERVKIKVPGKGKQKGSMKETRQWVKISTTIDARLNELMVQECRRLKMLGSEFLDSLLYTYFGEPKLSNE
jgi:Asp-tRNA(Asn)/Glu-tRNA(Gln) amidotransferase C subunit